MIAINCVANRPAQLVDMSIEIRGWRMVAPGRLERFACTPLPPAPGYVRVEVAGSVIVRQRPGTAKGFFFVTLEDETGFANAIITPSVFQAHRSLLTTCAALIVGGKLQNQDGVVAVKADRFESLTDLGGKVPSRDFR